MLNVCLSGTMLIFPNYSVTTKLQTLKQEINSAHIVNLKAIQKTKHLEGIASQCFKTSCYTVFNYNPDGNVVLLLVVKGGRLKLQHTKFCEHDQK